MLFIFSWNGVFDYVLIPCFFLVVNSLLPVTIMLGLSFSYRFLDILFFL